MKITYTPGKAIMWGIMIYGMTIALTARFG